MQRYLVLASILFVAQLKAQQSAHFRLEEAELTATEKIYNFIADDYDHVLSFQYSLSFDQARMQFKEVRNPVIEGMNNSNFGTSYPGYLVTSWFDPDVDPADLPNPVAIYQLVFDVNEPGGSTLCFSTEPLEYELSLEQEIITQIIIDDECNTGLVLHLNSTAVSDPVTVEKMMNDISLSRDGVLDFTAAKSQWMELTLCDISGRAIVTVDEVMYTDGRHSVATDKLLQAGIYFLRVRNENGHVTAYTLFPQN